MSTPIHVIALVLGLSAGALAQKPPTESPPKQVPPESSHRAKEPGASPVISIASLRGAEIVFEGAPPEKSGPAGGREAANSPKAKVADLILSTRDGRLAYVIVSVGAGPEEKEKTVLVPAGDMKFAMMDVKPSATIRMTPAQLRGQSPFDLDKAKREGVEVALGEGKAAPADAPSTKQKGGDDGGGNPRAEAVPKFALSSQLGTWGIHASDRPFGQVKDAAVDTERSAVAYVLAASNGGGDTILVPFAACTCARAETNLVLKVAKTTEQLGSAPRYEKPSQGLLTIDQMKLAEEFFGTRGAVSSQG